MYDANGARADQKTDDLAEEWFNAALDVAASIIANVPDREQLSLAGVLRSLHETPAGAPKRPPDGSSSASHALSLPADDNDQDSNGDAKTRVVTSAEQAAADSIRANSDLEGVDVDLLRRLIYW
jgi:hypothetical protein